MDFRVPNGRTRCAVPAHNLIVCPTGPSFGTNPSAFNQFTESSEDGWKIAFLRFILPFYEPGQRHDTRFWGRPPLGIGLDFARQVHQIGGRSCEVRLSEVLAGLSYSLDLTEGQRPGHAVRTCQIGMRVADVIGLNHDQRSALFYALLLKDLGCSSNAARFAALFGADDHHLKADIKLIDWPVALESFRYVARNAAPGQFFLRRVWRMLAVLLRGPSGAREVVRTRCERGAEIARMLGCADETAQAIRCIDEHWDGRGQPYHLAGEQISLLGRIVGLAQTVEVFFSAYGIKTAYDMAVERRGQWFDPQLVDALESVRHDTAFWQWVGEGDSLESVPRSNRQNADPAPTKTIWIALPRDSLASSTRNRRGRINIRMAWRNCPSSSAHVWECRNLSFENSDVPRFCTILASSVSRA